MTTMRTVRPSFSVLGHAPAGDVQSQANGVVKIPLLKAMLCSVLHLTPFPLISFNYQGVPSRILLGRPVLF